MKQARPEVFVLDANVFMEAHRRYYARDICPGFWACLSDHGKNARLLSIDRVRSEIADGDALSAWVEEAPESLFVSSAESAVVDAYSEFMAWVQASTQFRPEAKAEFAGAADGWLAAYAKVHGSVLVTHEEFHPDARKRVPLPNICNEFLIPYCDTFAMLRKLEARFEWAG